MVEEAEAVAVAAGAPQGFPVSMATAPDADVDDDVAHAAMTKINPYHQMIHSVGEEIV